MPFRDHFSNQAGEYARFRPGYPQALFDYLAGQAPSQKLAWDCGTGSGQAAVRLAERFQRVIATDASQAQIEHAVRQPGIEYRVEPAESTSIDSHTVDLITAGVAVHWFEFDPYYTEVRRVANPGALIAVWTYHYPAIAPEVDAFIEQMNRELLSGYWPERIRYLEEHYATLPFPFEPVPAPRFEMQTEWYVQDMAGFINSWSATQRYLTENGEDALESVWTELGRAWGGADKKRLVSWPLYLRVGRVHYRD
jgi:SAM-dependent methyltransferase